MWMHMRHRQTPFLIRFAGLLRREWRGDVSRFLLGDDARGHKTILHDRIAS